MFKVKDVVPPEHRNAQADKAFPLVEARDNDVMEFISRKVDPSNPSAMLWELVRFASQSHGRLRSDAGVVDPSSPEAAICNFLLGHPLSCITPPSVQDLGSMDPAAVAETMAVVQGSLLKGQREKALAAALEAKQYPLALLIASICGRQKYQEVVREYMGSIR